VHNLQAVATHAHIHTQSVSLYIAIWIVLITSLIKESCKP